MDVEAAIQAKGLTAPRVTPQLIAQKIKSEWYFTASQGVSGSCAEDPHGHQRIEGVAINQGNLSPALGILTFCVLELENGFTVTGHSAPASLENFDPELGREIAKRNAINAIWPLEGYLLRERLSAPNRIED